MKAEEKTSKKVEVMLRVMDRNLHDNRIHTPHLSRAPFAFESYLKSETNTMETKLFSLPQSPDHYLILSLIFISSLSDISKVKCSLTCKELLSDRRMLLSSNVIAACAFIDSQAMSRVIACDR